MSASLSRLPGIAKHNERLVRVEYCRLPATPATAGFWRVSPISQHRANFSTGWFAVIPMQWLKSEHFLPEAPYPTLLAGQMTSFVSVKQTDQFSLGVSFQK